MAKKIKNSSKMRKFIANEMSKKDGFSINPESVKLVKIISTKYSCYGIFVAQLNSDFTILCRFNSETGYCDVKCIDWNQ